MTRARMVSRTFSYSKKFTTSFNSIFLFMGLVGEPVGLGEDLDGMAGLHSRPLLDLQGGERAVRGHAIGAGLTHAPEQRLRELHGQLEVFLLHPPGAVHGR